MNQYIIAFWGGIISFLSPCVLPLIPVYISIISGVSTQEILKEENKKINFHIIISALLFILGFSLVFSIMGAGASYLGGFLIKYKIIFQKVMASILVLIGLHISGLINIKFLNYEKRIQIKTNSDKTLKSFNTWSKYLLPFLTGCAFAIGWSPCIGPILAGILVMASTSAILSKGFLLLLTYSLGLGIPFILAAILSGFFFKFISKYRKIFKYTETISGIIIILAGILLFFDKINIG